MLKYLSWQTLGIRVQQLCFRAVEPRSKYKCIPVHCFAVQLLLLCYSHCHFCRLVAPASTQLGVKDVLLHYCRLKLQPGQTRTKVNVTEAARIDRLGFGRLTYTRFASNLQQLQKRIWQYFHVFFFWGRWWVCCLWNQDLCDLIGSMPEMVIQNKGE